MVVEGQATGCIQGLDNSQLNAFFPPKDKQVQFYRFFFFSLIKYESK